jgi:tellurite resistance protein TerC
MTLAIWAGTFAGFAVLMVADLALTRKAVGWRAAATSSALWIAAALAFGGALWLWRGPATAGQYFAGYLLEKALSVDNVFVFVMLFASLGVPAPLQRRVLHLGVAGALVLRGGFIAAGGALYFLLAGSVDRFAYLKQGIAVLLVFIGVKMLISPFVHLPVWMSLAAIVAGVAGAVAASLWRDRHRTRQPPGR